MLTLKLGRRYRNRDGQETHITSRFTRDRQGFQFRDACNRIYKRNGKWGIDRAHYEFDLIEDLGLKVELTKTYSTDTGKTETLDRLIPSHHPFYKDGFRFISESGRFYRSDGSRCRDRLDDFGNLVEEVQR